MKTIEEIAKEISEHVFFNERHVDIFSAIKDIATRSIVESQIWIPIEEELPICLESGDWDGLRSDYVIAKFKDNTWCKAILYSGFIDGIYFNDWYDDRNYDIINITHWRPIELK